MLEITNMQENSTPFIPHLSEGDFSAGKLKSSTFKIKNSSARALVWFSAILILAGMMVMSPAGGFAMFATAAIN